MLKGRKNPGIKMFTTVELLTVMAILAILMAMGLGVYSLASNKMAESRTKALIQQISNALELYKAKHGYYIQQFSNPGFYLDIPTTTYPEDDFTDFLANYEQMKNSDSEEVATDVYALVDGFGNQLIYYCPGKVNTETFDLISKGSDTTVTDGYITNYK
jgi:type II secretory pathway pseudopilin PulG